MALRMIRGWMCACHPRNEGNWDDGWWLGEEKLGWWRRQAGRTDGEEEEGNRARHGNNGSPAKREISHMYSYLLATRVAKNPKNGRKL